MYQYNNCSGGRKDVKKTDKNRAVKFNKELTAMYKKFLYTKKACEK